MTLFVAGARSFRLRFHQFVAWSIHTVVFFSPYFCFLVILVSFVLMLSVLLLAAVCSLPWLFETLSSNPRHGEYTLSSMYTSSLPPHFRDTCCLFRLSLWCMQLTRTLVHLSHVFTSQLDKRSRVFDKGDYPGLYAFVEIYTAQYNMS